MKARLALLFSVLFCATALAADLSFEAKVDKFLGGINAATTKPSPAKLAKIATACVKKGLMLRAKEVAALVKKDTQAAKTLSVMIEANTSILGKWQIADDTLPPYHIVCRANGTVYAHTPDNPHAPWRWGAWRQVKPGRFTVRKSVGGMTYLVTVSGVTATATLIGSQRNPTIRGHAVAIVRVK